MYTHMRVEVKQLRGVENDVDPQRRENTEEKGKGKWNNLSERSAFIFSISSRRRRTAGAFEKQVFQWPLPLLFDRKKAFPCAREINFCATDALSGGT